jgi:hypothetical protein
MRDNTELFEAIKESLLNNPSDWNDEVWNDEKTQHHLIQIYHCSNGTQLVLCKEERTLNTVNGFNMFSLTQNAKLHTICMENKQKKKESLKEDGFNALTNVWCKTT